MGLDMYLEKRTYVKNWDYMKPMHRHVITVTKGDGSASAIKPERISYITEEVAYWRKANAIHRWFVANVQDGKDDCEEYYVSREKLQELKTACDKVLAASKMKPSKVENGYIITSAGRTPILEDGEVITDPQIAETVLPTQAGFFFGPTNYDQYYIAGIQATSDILAELLSEPDTSGDFYYRASW